MHHYLFYFCLIVALVGWASLIALPNSRWTGWIVQSKSLHALICLFYTLAVFTAKGVPKDAGFFSVQGVLALFRSEDAVIAAWLHIIVFDFFVGIWIVEDACKRHIPRALIIFSLLVTVMFGPLGLLIYLFLRSRQKSSGKSYANL